jgi:hypothetical protein
MTIRTQNPEIFKLVVGSVSVDVVEFKRDSTVGGRFGPATFFTVAWFQSGSVQPSFQFETLIFSAPNQ